MKEFSVFDGEVKIDLEANKDKEWLRELRAILLAGDALHCSIVLEPENKEAWYRAGWGSAIPFLLRRILNVDAQELIGDLSEEDKKQILEQSASSKLLADQVPRAFVDLLRVSKEGTAHLD